MAFLMLDKRRLLVQIDDLLNTKKVFTSIFIGLMVRFLMFGVSVSSYAALAPEQAGLRSFKRVTQRLRLTTRATISVWMATLARPQ